MSTVLSDRESEGSREGEWRILEREKGASSGSGKGKGHKSLGWLSCLSPDPSAWCWTTAFILKVST